MNTIGKQATLTLFGESHGRAIGCVLDGLPSGEAIELEQVHLEMARRAPGRNQLSTARKEGDAFEIESGYFNGYTTGTPLCAMIYNTDHRSADYDQLRHVMRPGHADYSGKIRYGSFNDYRGGGHFSGRITAPLVFAGAVASQIITRRGITIGAHIQQIATVQDRPFQPLGENPETLQALRQQALPFLDPQKGDAAKKAILDAKGDLDSVGGIIAVSYTHLTLPTN